MKDLRSEQWATFESAMLGATIVVCALTVALLPYLIPRTLLSSWPMAPRLYESLGVIFPYLGRSLPFSKDPAFYVASKLVLFGVGTACIVICSSVPLSRKVIVRDHSVIDKAKKSIWWFWLLFAIAGYGVFFDSYKPSSTLSWASKKAVEFPMGIAIGNFVQFGVFALAAVYVILLRHYFRLCSVWKGKHVTNH
jgi:hypothetical protein